MFSIKSNASTFMQNNSTQKLILIHHDYLLLFDNNS